jgi:hypothetical protein
MPIMIIQIGMCVIEAGKANEVLSDNDFFWNKFTILFIHLASVMINFIINMIAIVTVKNGSLI